MNKNKYSLQGKIFISILIFIFFIINFKRINYGLPYFLNLDETAFLYSTLTYLNFITKMHYKARADQKWIEHEVDYIFALKKDVKIDPNPNEIQRTKYVDVKELNELFEKSNDNDIKIGPWFRLIRDNFLNEIWKNIDSLDAISDNKVHHMGEVK